MPNYDFIYKFYYEWWKNINKTLFLLIMFLFSLGLFFSLVSTSLIASDKLDTNNYFFFFKHFIYILIGIIVLIFFSSFSKENLFKLSFYLFFISLFFLFLVPFLGMEVNGSTRWVNLFFIPRFQPVEIVKPFMIIFISTILCSEKNFNIYFKYLVTFITIVPSMLFINDAT